jgi:hypothetical protein
VTTSSEEPREERIMSDDMESASLVARKTSQWRETLRCWVVAGFEYAARVTAMREGHVWHPMLPVKTDAKQLSLDSKIADITVLNVCIVAACCVDAKD